ncbi:unnamed protein product [Peniophora sp. CBMAI 1063]|nr:unnamed protein product [Peniophora sp. CBMAI 1063]
MAEIEVAEQAPPGAQLGETLLPSLHMRRSPSHRMDRTTAAVQQQLNETLESAATRFESTLTAMTEELQKFRELRELLLSSKSEQSTQANLSVNETVLVGLTRSIESLEYTLRLELRSVDIALRMSLANINQTLDGPTKVLYAHAPRANVLFS